MRIYMFLFYKEKLFAKNMCQNRPPNDLCTCLNDFTRILYG